MSLIIYRLSFTNVTLTFMNMPWQSLNVKIGAWRSREECDADVVCPSELARDAGLTAEQEMCGVLKSLLDSLVSEMSDRFSRLRDLNSQFGFLLNTKSLLLQQVADGADDIDIPSCVHNVCTLTRFTVMTSMARSCFRKFRLTVVD